MNVDERQAEIIRTFATLADSLVAGFDAVDLLQTLVERSAELLDASDAGILLADGTGRLGRPRPARAAGPCAPVPRRR